MVSKFFILSLLSIAISLPSLAQERKLYVGSDSSEASLSFDFHVDYAGDDLSEEKAKEKIDTQLNHLFGPMGESAYPAVPKGDQKATEIKITKNAAGGVTAAYHYEGTVVLKNGPTDEYEIVLPYNVDTIYKNAMVGTRNPCTDDHYQSEGDFWYFWNPNKTNCKLKEGKDFEKILAKVTRIENSKVTFPEYERLADANNEISVSLIMGMDDPKNSKNPNTSKDINADNFRMIKASLVEKGYKNHTLKAEEIKKLVNKDFKPIPYIEEFSKTVGKYKIKMRIFFNPTGIDEESRNFHHFFKYALEHSSVMIYDGHSGLGGHLDIGSIESEEKFTITPNKDRYQIYFFNSCSSYTYYNSMFFNRKKSEKDPNGTKNLDILTNGLATYFDVMHSTNLALVQAIEMWAQGKARASYQTIAKKIDSGNLFGINGDEDNPTN